MKGAALRSFGMFQGKYQSLGYVNEKPFWTSKGKVIWYGYNNWLIGDGKNAAIYSSSTQSFPYDKEIQWYIQGKKMTKEKFKHSEIDIKCTMKTGELYILDYENLEILFQLSTNLSTTSRCLICNPLCLMGYKNYHN